MCEEYFGTKPNKIFGHTNKTNFFQMMPIDVIKLFLFNFVNFT